MKTTFNKAHEGDDASESSYSDSTEIIICESAEFESEEASSD